MSLPAFPTAVEDISAAYLTQVIAAFHPGAVVESFAVVSASRYGSGAVSTADRLLLDLRYGPGSPSGLPTRVLVKTTDETLHAPPVMYANEVGFYTDIRPGLDMEAPFCLGAVVDGVTGQFAILMEDLTQRGARFPRGTDHVSLSEVESLVDNLCRLHGRFWDSPRFGGDLAWVGSHTRGALHDMFDTVAPLLAENGLRTTPFKVDLLARIGRGAPRLWADTQAVQRHQARQTPTLCHGDAHIGNTYLLPRGGGLLDWQLMSRGRWAHDFTYLLCTAMTTEQRRRHQQELLQRYLAGLAQQNVKAAPSFAAAWEDYRLAAVWGLFIGWLIVPEANYGLEYLTLMLERMASACEDLDTFALIDRLAA